MAILKNWSIVASSDNPYLAPELRGMCLQGEVYDHPNSRHPDGKILSLLKLLRRLMH